MKRSSLILAVVFLLSMVSFQRMEAQDKTKEEKQKEQQIQEAIDAQKKAMVEQKKAQEEVEKTREEAKILQQKAQQQAEEALRKYKVVVPEIDEKNLEKLDKIYEEFGRQRSFSNGEPFVFTPGVEFFGRHFGGDEERTTWEFSKSVKETTFTRDYTFDVESTVNTVVMAVNGDCTVGEIRVKIVMPNGKTYSDIVIDEFGNLNWRKSFTISDTENKDKAGAWRFEINSTKATGYFKISLQTY
jgi:type II secretory pathway pseudopilin PulG